ncbi:MAG: glycine/betaine/sarcosine/D-proline family reductase selenoprotein B [Candidatus Hydrogenedentes bacterium]|nr:glycine/betaine/sarcosine/D-proline family reductase selenoprotein B [Candidatus Hydrogenedentota bacterium]
MRIVHYMNQFFAGIGGEDKADTPPQSKAGSIGPGRLLQQTLGTDAEVVGTVICGDGLFADRMEHTAPEVLRLIAELEPDVVIAGPAFNAGRYGLACGRVCADVEQKLKIPALTGMYPENAAAEVYGRAVLIVPTAASALGMKDGIGAIARLALKLGRGETLGPAAVEGYLPRGQRTNTRVGTSASERVLDLLLKRLKGETFETEVPLPKYEAVTPPAPVADVTRVRLALVTESGLVPKGNPGRLEWVRASRWLKYSIAGKERLEKGEYEVVHSGYDAAFALEDPDRLVPVDAARELARRGEIGSLLDTYYVTCGNHGILSEMAQYSKDIAGELKAQDVGAVLLVAT